MLATIIIFQKILQLIMGELFIYKIKEISKLIILIALLKK